MYRILVRQFRPKGRKRKNKQLVTQDQPRAQTIFWLYLRIPTIGRISKIASYFRYAAHSRYGHSGWRLFKDKTPRIRYAAARTTISFAEYRRETPSLVDGTCLFPVEELKNGGQIHLSITAKALRCITRKAGMRQPGRQRCKQYEPAYIPSLDFPGTGDCLDRYAI